MIAGTVLPPPPPQVVAGENSNRPNVKGYFQTISEIHANYKASPALFNYAQALDKYIDHLEDVTPRLQEIGNRKVWKGSEALGKETDHQFDDLKIDLKWGVDVTREEIEKEVLSCLDEMEKYRKGQPHGLAVISVSIKDPDRGITVVNVQETSKELLSVQPIAGKSLEECKNEVALKNGYESFMHLRDTVMTRGIVAATDEAHELYATQRQPEWISASQQLPDNSDEVLVLAPNCYIIGQSLIGKYFAPEGNHKASWTVYDFGQSNLHEFVTHWMPLPQPPKDR